MNDRTKMESNGQKKKGADNMQTVLKESSRSIKMQLLKARADAVLKDESLRHIPNEHDIKECSDNTKLLYACQEKTIREED